MFNLIKMNFYRLFHQRSFYVCVAVAVFIGWFMPFMIWLTPRMEDQIAAQKEAEEGFAAGFYVGLNEDEIARTPKLEVFNVTEFADQFTKSGFCMILVSVAIPLFVNADRKRGFIKNLGGQVRSRGVFTLAKLPVILFETALLMAASILSIAVFGRIYFEQYTFGDVGAMCRVMSVQLFLETAFGALIMLICTLARNAASGIIAGIVMSSGLFPMVYFQINKFAVAYLGAPMDFDCSKCFLDYHISMTMSTTAGSELVSALLAGGIYLVLALAAGCLVMEKRDI